MKLQHYPASWNEMTTKAHFASLLRGRLRMEGTWAKEVLTPNQECNFQKKVLGIKHV